MVEKTDINKIKSLYPSFFEAFSFSFIDFVIGGQMAQRIANICIENRVLDQEKIQKISYHITFVVFDKMDIDRLPSKLEEDAGVSSEIAQKITKSVNEIIFSQIAKIKKDEDVEKKKAEKKEDDRPVISVTLPSSDTYREPIN